jgi:hypothetical protein
VSLDICLEVGSIQTSVTVSADSRSLIDPEETGSHAQMNQDDIDRLASIGGSRGLESVLVSLPGFAKNANGAIHPRGAHNQMTFVIDGMPISDQLTGAFANALDPSVAQTVELFTGNISAEYGGKVAAVANITTLSGTGTGTRFQGNAFVDVAQFDTLTQVAHISGENGRLGYSGSLNLMKSNRYLDQVSLDNLHNGGNSERGFLRLDHQATAADMLRLSVISGRSSFQLANLRSQHARGQDQRQLLRDLSVSLGWLRILNARSTLDATLSYRTAASQLFSSPGDTPVTADQARHLTTVNAGMRWNRIFAAHSLRAGGDYQRFPVSENFGMGITSPSFNSPGSGNYNPNLAPYDLSRGGSPFRFSAKDSGSFYSLFVQDDVQWARLRFSLGLRHDTYRFLVRGSQLQPRLGLAFLIRESGTVLRASYNRTYQTPPNENLLLSNSSEAASLAPPGVRAVLGDAVVAIRPERQNVYEVGIQQTLGPKASVNASFFHKDSRDQQDNNNFLNTGVVFPISLQGMQVNGFEARIVTLPMAGISGDLSITHSHAVSTPPFTGGVFLGNEAVVALSQGPFVIDHDQALSMHGVVQYRNARGFWASCAIRYDSGLVANPSDPNEVARDPDYYDLLPYVNLTAALPRVRPRTVTDLVLGYERRGDRGKRWEASVHVTNLTNETGLYSFQSIFVGTRVLSPRTFGLRLRWYW